jgi:transcriptional regulator with PAS, ATPase and Fis domain
MTVPPPAADAPKPFRIERFLQGSSEPLFLLNGRRRLLYANAAWEKATGLTLAALRGRACRRAPRDAGREEAALSLLSPPPQAWQGEAASARRRVPWIATPPTWWEIHYLPFHGADGVLGVLGRMRVQATGEPTLTLPDKLMTLRDRASLRYRLDDFDADTPALRCVVEQARLAASQRCAVTLVGEAGVGKAWLARAIHLAGPGRNRYFALVDAERLPLSALVDMLGETRLVSQSVGSLHLREPGRLPRELQERVVELIDKQADDATLPRVTLGFRDEPLAQVQAGALLAELYHGAAALTIRMPPLRERSASFARHVERCVQACQPLRDPPVRRVAAEALQVLAAHDWPNHFRELLEVIRDASLRAKSDVIEWADLPFHVKQAPIAPPRELPLEKLLEATERKLVAVALQLTGGNKSQAAKLLGVWRPQLLNRMKRLGLSGDDAEGV